MTDVHEEHAHSHNSGCGHVAVRHRGHLDYVHDGHLHRHEGGAITECAIETGPMNPAACTDGHPCQAHDGAHLHGPDCGHPRIPHGDHQDYLVSGHLHHLHNGHCDDHGALELS